QVRIYAEIKLILVAEKRVSHKKGEPPADAVHRPLLYRISSRNSPEAGAVHPATSNFSSHRPSSNWRNSSVVISCFPTFTRAPTIRRTMRHKKCDPAIRN